MARTRTNKNGTISILGLTPDEYHILWECLSRCQDVMYWDEQQNAADDGDNFLWYIDDKKEYETLKNLSI